MQSLIRRYLARKRLNAMRTVASIIDPTTTHVTQ